MKKWICLVSVLLSGRSFAQVSDAASETQKTETKYIVKQVIKSHKLVVVQTNATEEFPNGKIFLANFEDGSQCSLVLKNSGKQLLTLDSSPCDQASRINTKTMIEPSLVAVFEQPQSNPPPAKEATERKPEEKPQEKPQASYDEKDAARLGVMLYYTSADQLRFDDGKIESQAVNFKATYDLEKAVGLGLIYTRAHQNSWGFSFGAFFESKRDFKSGSITTSTGNSSSGSISSTKISFLLAEINALYRFNQFYFPFGLNFSAPILEYQNTSTTLEVTGGVGVQFGLGYFVSDNLAAELFARSIGLTLTGDTGTTKIEYGRGTLTGAGFGLKYLF